MSEELLLEGGATGARVFLRAGAVHRPFTQDAAEYLSLLPRVGIDWVPRLLGWDGDGNARLSYLPGTAGLERASWHPSAAIATARLLRELHQRTAAHLEIPWEQRRAVIHGDPGPWNVVFDDAGMPRGLFDWEYIQVGPTWWDIGNLGWYWCITGNGEADIATEARHLARVRDAYDPSISALQMLQAMHERMDVARQWCLEHLEDPLPVVAENARTSLQWGDSCRHAVATHERQFIDALSS